MKRSGSLQSVENLGTTIFLVRVKPTTHFKFAAGQYVKLEDGYYSIASPPESEVLEFVVRAAGRGAASDRLVHLPLGSELAIEGPFGNLTYQPLPDRHVVFVCQGTGVSPLFSIARSRAFAETPPLSALFLVGCRNELEHIRHEKFALPVRDGQYRVTLSQPAHPTWPGMKGRVTHHLKHDALGIDWAHTEFYICGSFEMIAETKDALTTLGVAPESIHAEA